MEGERKKRGPVAFVQGLLGGGLKCLWAVLRAVSCCSALQSVVLVGDWANLVCWVLTTE